MPVLSNNLKDTLVWALDESSRQKYVTLEHVLLALLGDPDAREMFSKFSVDREKLNELHEKLSTYIDNHPPQNSSHNLMAVDPCIQNVLLLAINGARTFGHETVTGAHVLWMLSLQHGGEAVRLLHEQGVTGSRVREFIAKNPVSGAGEEHEDMSDVPAFISWLMRSVESEEPKIAEVMGAAVRLRTALKGCPKAISVAAIKIVSGEHGL